MQQRSPLAPPLGELAAKPTERVKQAPPPLRGTSPIGRGKALIRHGFAVTPSPEGKALGQGYHSRVWGFSQALLYLSADLWYTSPNHY